MRACLAILALLLGSAVSASAAKPWQDWTEFGADDPAYNASKALCRAAASAPLPRLDGPAPPASCSAENLLYGIGVPADAAAARRCAIATLDRDPDRDDPYGAAPMLMTMLANGQGGPRDLKAATRLACDLNGSLEEMDGRIKHLAAMEKEGDKAAPFDVCDDVTSGALQGSCAAHDSALAAQKRDLALAEAVRGLGPAQQAAFGKARTAAEAFADARGGNEIDLGGTARTVFTTEASDAVRDDLLALVQALKAPPPHPLPTDFAAEDKALNAAYGAVMATRDPQWGTVTKDGVRTTQRLWLAYRDAMAGFADQAFGPAAASAAKTALTRRRVANLRAILD